MVQRTKSQARKRTPFEAENVLTLTPRETVQYTRFGINRTYQLLRSGRMPSIQVGKRFFVPKAALIKWLESPDAGWVEPRTDRSTRPLNTSKMPRKTT